ncbi:flagellar basal body-associated FliL family protein [bacterium]|nr:flagellar basal body-associated FliL family protein [bacterium]
MINEFEIENDEQIDQKAPKKRFPLKLIIIIGSIVIVGTLIAFGGFYLYGYLKSSSKEEKAATTSNGKYTSSEKSDDAQPNKEAVLFPLDTFYANITGEGEIRYLKVTMSLELIDSKGVDYLNKNLPKVRDNILILLSSKTIKDLSSTQGKLLVKNQIKAHINLLLKSVSMVKDVYFTEFIIQ